MTLIEQLSVYVYKQNEYTAAGAFPLTSDIGAKFNPGMFYEVLHEASLREPGSPEHERFVELKDLAIVVAQSLNGAPTKNNFIDSTTITEEQILALYDVEGI